MEQEKIHALCEKQRATFASGVTLPVSYRLSALKRLREAVMANQEAIAHALSLDLGKHPAESYMCEIGMALSEISFMLKHLRRLTSRRRVRTPLAQFSAKSYTLSVPYGCTLIMSPWNYPFLLTVGPLIDAIAAGNCVILKPSAYAPAMSALLARLLSECFDEGYVAVVEGGRAENTSLLKEKFDHIFFTGSTAVGKTVLAAAAEHLTPVSLELGGKSPVIVDETPDIPLAARRIVFGKLLNCGQTCVAPDYILCHASIKDALVRALVAEIEKQLGKDPIASCEYGHIVNEKHFDRLLGLIDPEKTVYGGQFCRESLKIAPTVMDGVTFLDPVMGEEIFGPILPVLTFDRFDEIPALLADRPKPLSLYLFSKDKARIRFVESHIPFGGGCINDTVIHLATDQMGFGGVGESGMGSYHGEAGFDCFSHKKSIVSKRCFIDLPMRYHPYTKAKSSLIRRFLK